MLRCVEWRRVSDVLEYFIAFSLKAKQCKMITDVFLNCLNLRMEILRSLEMSVNIYPEAERDVSEDLNLHQHRCDNLKSRNEPLSHLRLSVCEWLSQFRLHYYQIFMVTIEVVCEWLSHVPITLLPRLYGYSRSRFVSESPSFHIVTGFLWLQ
jgi:hypothetical protein